MADKPSKPTPKRRSRKKTVPDLPPIPDPPESLGQRMSPDAVGFLIGNPLMASRRMKLDSREIIQMVGDHLVRQGMSSDALVNTRWLWVGTQSGCPELYLILPGPEA